MHTKLVAKRRNHPAELMSEFDHDSQLGGPSTFQEDALSAADSRHELAKVRIKKRQEGATVPI